MEKFEERTTIPSSSGSDSCLKLTRNSDNDADVLVDPDVRGDLYSGEVFLSLNEGDASQELVRLGMSEEENLDVKFPQIYKAEVGYTPNIEELISSLTSPLQVVHNVDPKEVLSNIEVWLPAIQKELNAVSHAVDKLPPGDERRNHLLRDPDVQRLPTKLVFTVKPGDAPSLEDPATWIKRKVRLVACGNLASNPSDDTYSGTAPAEVVRAALILASGRGWIAGIIDIVSAFLKTPLIGSKSPRIIVQPPKVLERSSVIPVGELWWLTHALYGLREAPRLWGQYRDDMLKPLVFTHDGVEYKIEQGRTESSWWAMKDPSGCVVGIMVIYVDDILICSEISLVRALAMAVSGLWKTTELSVAVPGCPLRFLGIEIEVDSDGVFWISQTGYINELLRSRQISPRSMDLIPINRELACLDAEPPEGEVSPELIREAQGLTGEVLWLSQRTRPDLSFTASAMATLCSRDPVRAIALGNKTMRYLNRTAAYRLRMGAGESTLAVVTDASFSPEGTRSRTGWVILMQNTPILWRSSRQTIMSLSTAEAELNAMLEGGVALLSVEALLLDMGIHFNEKLLVSDSTSALSISEGSCSWRTRHLRIRAHWLHESISSGQIKVSHCSGERLVADLLTKPLSSARLRSLLQLWGMKLEDVEQAATAEPTDPAAQAEASTEAAAAANIRVCTSGPPIAQALISLLALLQVRESEGLEVVSAYEELAPRGISVDKTLLTTTGLMVAILCCVCAWELLKWSLVATSRRARRLARLRDRTRQVVQRELDRHAIDVDLTESEPLCEPPGRQTPSSRPGPKSQADHRIRRREERTGTSAREESLGQDLVPENDGGARSSTDTSAMRAVVRGLRTRSRGPFVERSVQTAPLEPEVVVREIPVRVEVPVQVPNREGTLLADFEAMPTNLVMSQYGEHYHLSADCDGLRKATSRVRHVGPCLACIGNVQLYRRRRSFRRLTPSNTG